MGLTVGTSTGATAPSGSIADKDKIEQRKAENTDNTDNKILGLDKKIFYIVAGGTLLVAGLTTFVIIRKKRKNK